MGLSRESFCWFEFFDNVFILFGKAWEIEEEEGTEMVGKVTV